MSRGYTPIALLLFLLASCGQPEPELDPGSDASGESAEGGTLLSAGLEARPLPDRLPTGGKMFTRLPAAQTGIDFVNPVDQSHPMKYLYASTMGCGGVAIGDFDDDGRPDLYFTGGPRANVLYRQVGTLEFEDVTAAAGVDGGGAWSTGAALVDFDNDGDLDIYVCNYDSPNLLYRNEGGGQFSESAAAAGLDFVGAGHTPAFCDFDLDGDLDLYLLTNYFYHPGGRVTGKISELRDGKPAILEQYRKYYGISAVAKDPQSGGVRVSHDAIGDSDRFVRNDGDGTFTEITRPGQIVGKGNAAIWWDEDLDGWPDLYVANDFKDPDRLFHNNRDGGFGEIIKQRVPHTTWFSMGADSADLDGDARPDLMVADMSGTNHFKQKVGMGAMGENSEFLKTADPRQYMRNAVFLNPGGGRYLEAAYLTGLASSDWTWTVRLSDFDNDARVDVFLTNGMAVDLNVVDNPDAIEARPGETEWDKHVRAKTPQLKEQNLAFRNLGDLRFDDVSEAWGLDHVGMSYAASAADLDRDGDLEIVVANLEEVAGVYQNHSAAGNCVLVELRGAQSNRRGIGATVQLETSTGVQTRFLTLNRGYMAAGEAVMHFGLGEAEEISRLSVRWPGGGEQVFEGIRANQHLTITEDSGGGGKAPVEEVAPPLFQRVQSLAGAGHREVPFDDFGRQPLLPHKLSQLGPGIAVGDIDGDGEDDVFIGGARGDVGKLIRHLGGGKMEAVACPVLVEDRGYEDMGVIFFDSDGDGDLDLYVVSGGVECQPGDPILQDRLYLNDGSGNFSRGALMPACDSGSVVAATDFDSDG
ncbi:MAG: CRTAC1 family protein, partial [Verrucomicrobiales bacterium]